MDWHVVMIHTKSEAVELIADSLYEIGVKGIEIIDSKLTEQERGQLFIDYIDDQLVQKEEVQIKCYFSVDENIDELVKLIRQSLNHLSSFMEIGSGLIEISTTKEEDWANNWKQYYKPFRIGKNILIKPTWENYEDIRPHDIVVNIDPGMAFGCGTHETTSMCVLMLQKYLQEKMHIIDVGCGSGILSIIAAKLGAEKIDAVDIDELAVKVTKENLQINHLSQQVKVSKGDLIEAIHEPADIVVANIMADIVIMLTKDIKRVLKPNGLFISSGIIEEKKEDVLQAILSEGFEIVEVMQEKDWLAIAAKLKA